jgi:hypothetical protein
MQKRYDETLTTRLEDAVHNGCSHITWSELYLWYGVRKIAAGTYRDLDQRMKEIGGGGSVKPRMVQGRGGIFIYDAAKSKRIDPDAEK